MKHVLIAGASGLVGKVLRKRLEAKGYRVSTLSYTLSTDKEQNRFHWNPMAGLIDKSCLEGVDHVINLAGVGIFDHPWTKKYKQSVIDSRVDSTGLLARAIQNNTKIKTFINASAIGFYGADTGNILVDENTAQGTGFLAEVVQLWEQKFFELELKGVRRVALRLGIVLSEKGGALPKLSKPVKWFIGSPLGTGNQYISWIHIEDLCSLFIYAIEQESIEGFYNAVAPEPITNKGFVDQLAKRLKRPLFMPPVPAFVLNMLLGKEQAMSLLGGNRVKSDKIIKTGFQFEYKTLNQALHSFF